MTFSILLISCADWKRESVVDTDLAIIEQSEKPSSEVVESITSDINSVRDSFSTNDATFISQHLLQGRYKVELDRYDTIRRDYCLPEKLSKETAIKEFEGFKNVGDLDKDGTDEFAFVLPPINRCEDGQSYYFSNPAIPRIYTDSYCYHPESIFSIGDIDEDGSNEIAQYYSSCASRYKAITIWTLKNNIWKEVETFSYIINDEYKVFEDFGKLSKKVSRNKFKFLEISDISTNGGLVKEWKTISMR